MTFNALTFAAGYSALFVFSIGAMVWWFRRQRRSRHPLDKDLRLLRMPGEAQFKLIAEFEENLVQLIGGAALFPLLVAGVALWISGRLGGWGTVIGLICGVIAFVAAFIFSARRVKNELVEQNNRYLGYFGERVVAEALEPLKRRGWRIFHDVPCESGKARFNIDHVAIGPGGVFAIETKTRRKGHARKDRKDHEVWFDGKTLSWPWGEDRAPIEQALGNAQWLQKKLSESTGEALQVAAVVTMPGWMVVEKGLGPLRVVNPKYLATVLASRRDELSDKQVDLFARQLEVRCRTVEF